MESEPGSPEAALLPLHPVPDLPNPQEWQLVLQNGDRLVTLDPAAIACLPHTEVVDSFTCLEGWTAGPLRWRGVRLRTLLEMVGGAPRDWIAVSAPDFRSVMPLADLPADALLADMLDERPLAREHGGPLRLVAPGAVCYRSVKWVQRIELQDSGEGDTAAPAARARLRRKRG